METVRFYPRDCMIRFLLVKEEILKLAKPAEIYVGPIDPIVGASTGPGTLITYCFGKEVTLVSLQYDFAYNNKNNSANTNYIIS